VERVGLGFAGVGWLGGALADAAAQNPDLRIVAVQDVDGSRAAGVADRHGAVWRGTDFEALLAVPGVDAVVISSPNVLHVPQSIAALQAGKHVLVQKPLAISPGGAHAVLAQAARTGRVLFVDYSYRYLDTVRELRQTLPLIGRVTMVTGAFHNIYGPGKAWFFDPKISGGGALVDLGVHLLDLAVELLAPQSTSLKEVHLSFRQGHLVEDAARLRVMMDGVPVNLDVSWNAALSESIIRLELHGERGTACWENVDGSFFRFRTVHNGHIRLDRETTLREDTLCAFAEALTSSVAPRSHSSVHEILASAYACPL
jgi:predicted dehydrogenase